MLIAARAALQLAPPERKYSTFIGGSILASLSALESAWITN